MSSEEIPRRRLRGPSEEAEQTAAQRFGRALDQMAAIIGRHSKVVGAQPQARSELASDDTLTDPLHMSHLVTYVQTVAIDNLKALRALLLPGDGLTLYQVAQYPLLRAAIESSAEVIWLLGPNDQRERVRRLLVARTSEFAYDRRMVAEAGAPRNGDSAAMSKMRAQLRQEAARSHKRNLGYLRQIASRAGLSEDDFIGTDLPWQDIIADASRVALQPSPEVGVTLWRVASGFSHPSSSRSLMMAVIEQDGEPIGDVIPARVSASVENVASTATGVVRLLQHSERLIRYRKIKVAGEDSASRA